jgi:hypothetical protein
MGWKWQNRKIKVFFYFDQWVHPWLKYLCPMPSRGRELMAAAECRPMTRTLISTRLRIKTTQSGQKNPDSGSFGGRKLTDKNRIDLRLQIEHRSKKGIRCRSRLEFKYGGREMEDRRIRILHRSRGLMLYHDLIVPLSGSFILKTRWCHFDAPEYDLRFFSYEHDLPGVMQCKMLYGRGTRWYILLQVREKKRSALSAKYQHTFYDDRDGMGSGADYIAGRHDNAFSCQLDWFY